MTGRELEQTRRYEMSDFPPGTRMLQGDRRELDAYLAQEPVRAVGRYRQLPGGGVQIPVVYVSQRARPAFHERHRIALVVSGGVLVLASGIAWAIMAVGVWWFLGGVVASAVVLATLVRYSRGGGRHRVSVTTTTTTKVRVR